MSGERTLPEPVKPAKQKEVKVDSVKQKILLDLFAAPSTVIPFALGATALIGAWAFDGPASLAFAGVCGVLVGAGMLANRWIFGLNKIALNAQQYVSDAEKQKDINRLNDLQHNLSQDNDPRTGRALTDLRDLRDGFRRAVTDGKITGAARSLMADKMDALFEACVKQLGLSHDMHINADNLRGVAQKNALDEREKVIADVLKTIDAMGQAVQQCYASKVESEDVNLSGLRQELQQSLEIARRADKQMADFGNRPGYKDPDSQ